MEEVATFKRGVDPKTTLGIGKFSHLKEWWEAMIKPHHEEVLLETRMENLVRKLVDVLREEHNDGWTRGEISSHVTYPGVKTWKSYLFYNRLAISISLCDDGNIYIWSDIFHIEPRKIGNLGINPGNVIKEILKLYEIVKEKQKQSDIDEAIEEYRKEVYEAMYRVDSLGVVPLQMIHVIRTLSEKRIKTDRKSFWHGD